MSGYAVKILNATPVVKPEGKAILDYCPCDYRCEFVENVFGGTGEYKGDKTSFLFTKVRASDTIVMSLRKNGTTVATLNNNTLGTFYDGFTAQPLYVGYLINWSLVLSAHGAGTYTIETELDILGSEFVETSRAFKLLPYYAKLASNTIKIESFQSGDLINSNIDYTDLVDGGWYSSIRLPAEITENFEQIEDRYLNSQFQLIQNREQVKATYAVNLKLIPVEIARLLARFYALSNKLRISTYLLNIEENLQNKEVIFEALGDSENKFNGKVNLEITFKDFKENNIKRNVR